MSNSRLLWSSMTVATAMLIGACSPAADETATDANVDAATTDTATKTIRIATEGAYPPFNMTNADGSLSGFDVDVANALCEQMQAQCEIVAQDWDGIIPGLLAQKYDAVVAGMSITPERQDKVDFTEPYFANTMVWLTDTDSGFDPMAIKDLTLGGQRSTTPGAYLQDNYEGKDGNTVQLYDNYDNAYLDLKSGRSNAVLAEKVSVKSWLADNTEGFGIVGDEIDNNDNIAIAVRKDDPLRDEFNKALSEIRSNGELARLEQENFGQ
nr:transporter substrate-binding domain-containing protein [uncultured Psychrobacter sp.]